MSAVGILVFYMRFIIMNKILKKLLVILPVLVISVLYLKVFFRENYADTSTKRVIGFALSVFLFYMWVLIIAAQKRQDTFFQWLVQSSFLVYVFAVLTFTGYFILFREIASQGWWDDMAQRVERREHVNLKPFEMFSIYSKFDRQVVGNFVMLMPLGIFLPLINRTLRKFSGLLAVFFVCLMVSVLIELMQLATGFRSADVDDVILNVAGGCVGFLIYQMMRKLIVPRNEVPEITTIN